MEPGSRRGETNLYHWQSRSSSTFSLPLCAQVFSMTGYSNNPLLAPSLLPSFIWNAFPRWSGFCLTSRAHRTGAAETVAELREGQACRCCCRFLLCSHQQAEHAHGCTDEGGVGWGRIWDERSTAVPLSGTGGVFSQLKSHRLADFHSSL